MSRKIDWGEALSDEDRAWARDRGMYLEVAENDRQFRPDEATDPTSHVAQTGLYGTEPSATADRTEPGGIGEAGLAHQANLKQRLAGSGDAGGDEEDDDLETKSKDELKDEAEKRGLAKNGSKQDLIDRIREHDAGNSEE